jgi:hypothetical protein
MAKNNQPKCAELHLRLLPSHTEADGNQGPIVIFTIEVETIPTKGSEKAAKVTHIPKLIDPRPSGYENAAFDHGDDITRNGVIWIKNKGRLLRFSIVALVNIKNE